MKSECEKQQRYALSQKIYKKSENIHTAPNAVKKFIEKLTVRDVNIGIAEIPIAISLNIGLQTG